MTRFSMESALTEKRIATIEHIEKAQADLALYTGEVQTQEERITAGDADGWHFALKQECLIAEATQRDLLQLWTDDLATIEGRMQLLFEAAGTAAEPAPVYYRCFAIGAAHREGRAPAHDGEYITVYRRAGDTHWLAEDNGGICAAWGHNVVDASVDAEATDEQIVEARELQERIDAALEEPVTHWGKAASATAAAAGAAVRAYYCEGDEGEVCDLAERLRRTLGRSAGVASA